MFGPNFKDAMNLLTFDTLDNSNMGILIMMQNMILIKYLPPEGRKLVSVLKIL